MVPLIGYERAAILAKRMLETRRPIGDLLLEMQDLGPEIWRELNHYLAPSSATHSTKPPAPDAE